MFSLMGERIYLETGAITDCWHLSIWIEYGIILLFFLIVRPLNKEENIVMVCGLCIFVNSRRWWGSDAEIDFQFSTLRRRLCSRAAATFSVSIIVSTQPFTRQTTRSFVSTAVALAYFLPHQYPWYFRINLGRCAKFRLYKVSVCFSRISSVTSAIQFQL